MHALHCIAMHCIAVQCSAVRCGAVRCGAVRCGAVRCGAVQCSVLHYTTLHYITLQYIHARMHHICVQARFNMRRRPKPSQEDKPQPGNLLRGLLLVLPQLEDPTHTHPRTHTRAHTQGHTRTHTHTHIRTDSSRRLGGLYFKRQKLQSASGVHLTQPDVSLHVQSRTFIKVPQPVYKGRSSPLSSWLCSEPGRSSTCRYESRLARSSFRPRMATG